LVLARKSCAQPPLCPDNNNTLLVLHTVWTFMSYWAIRQSAPHFPRTRPWLARTRHSCRRFVVESGARSGRFRSMVFSAKSAGSIPVWDKAAGIGIATCLSLEDAIQCILSRLIATAKSIMLSALTLGSAGNRGAVRSTTCAAALRKQFVETTAAILSVQPLVVGVAVGLAVGIAVGVGIKSFSPPPDCPPEPPPLWTRCCLLATFLCTPGLFRGRTEPAPCAPA
jgi:hypothetical protein